MPDQTTDQKIQQAIAQVRSEMPDVANAPIEPMGTVGQWLADLKSRAIGGQTQAFTSGGKIAFDPKALEGQSEHDLENLMAHELVHVRQQKKPSEPHPLGGFSYGQDPREMEAFQFEQTRANKLGRSPAITGVGFNGPRLDMDIQLPAEHNGPKLLPGSTQGIIDQNVRTLMAAGFSQSEATKRAVKASHGN